MTQLRHVLAPLTAIWLCCQIGTLALAPVALWIAATDPHAECTCGHNVGAMCPMHHRPVDRTGACVLRAADGGETAVVTALSAVGYTISEFSVSVRPDGVITPIRIADDHVTTERPVPPDPPPPRL